MPKVYGHVVHTQRISTNIEDLQRIAENTELSKKDLRLFLFLACRLETDKIKKIDIKQISKSLNLSKSDVENSLSNLEDFNIIEQGSDDHIGKGYRFTYTTNLKRIDSIQI